MNVPYFPVSNPVTVGEWLSRSAVEVTGSIPEPGGSI